MLLQLRTFFDSLLPDIFPLNALEFLGVLNDVRKAPFANAGNKQGMEKVEYDENDELGEGMCRVLVREFQDKQGARSECALILPLRGMRLRRAASRDC